MSYWPKPPSCATVTSPTVQLRWCADRPARLRQERRRKTGRKARPRVVAVGGSDDSEGYFVRPTVFAPTARPTRSFVIEVRGPPAVGACLPRRALQILDVIDTGSRYALTKRGHRRRPAGRADRAGSAAVRGGELLCQRQTDRAVVGRQPFRPRCTQIRHQRQGRFAVEPTAVDVGAQHQEDVSSRPPTIYRTWRSTDGRLVRARYAGNAPPAARIGWASSSARRSPAGWCAGSCPATRSVDIVTALRVRGGVPQHRLPGRERHRCRRALPPPCGRAADLDVLGRRGIIACDGVRPLECRSSCRRSRQALDRDGQKIALDSAPPSVSRAERVGAWVTVDAEDHTTDSTLSISGGCASTFLGWARLCRPICGAAVRGVGGRGRESQCKGL